MRQVPVWFNSTSNTLRYLPVCGFCATALLPSGAVMASDCSGIGKWSG